MQTVLTRCILHNRLAPGDGESVKKTIDLAIELDGDFAESILAMYFAGTILFDICKDLGILVEKDPILQHEFRHLCLSKAVVERLYRECF